MLKYRIWKLVYNRCDNTTKAYPVIDAIYDDFSLASAAVDILTEKPSDGGNSYIVQVYDVAKGR
jgi:hypothetical protein